jgi:hypothetical protein
MAYGDAVSSAVSSFYDGDDNKRFRTQLQGAGAIFDAGYAYRNARQAQQVAQETLALQRQIAGQQMTMAKQTAADEAAVRDRVLGRVSELDEALKYQLASLGGMAQVDGNDIASNYRTLREQGMQDYYDIVDRVSSQDAAKAMRRGMDRSTQFTDQQAALVRKSSDQAQKIDQAAFDAAINRSKAFAGAVNSGRTASLDEIKTALGSAIGYESPFATNNAYQQMSTAGSNYDQFADNAMDAVADTQGELGRTLGKFREEVAPNMGYAFGDAPNYVDVKGGDQARYVQFLEGNVAKEIRDAYKNAG